MTGLQRPNDKIIMTQNRASKSIRAGRVDSQCNFSSIPKFIFTESLLSLYGQFKVRGYTNGIIKTLKEIKMNKALRTTLIVLAILVLVVFVFMAGMMFAGINGFRTG